MTFDKTTSQFQGLLQEETSIRNEISRIQEAQRKMVFSSLASSGGILFFITVTSSIFEGQIDNLLNIIVPITMGLSLIFVMLFIIYIGLFFGILRLTEYALNVLYPKINSILELKDEEQIFAWENYLRETKRNNFFDWLSISTYAVGESVSLFMLVILYQATWIYLIIYSGHNLQTIHYIFLSIIFIVLVIIGFLSVRVMRLASKIKS